MAGEKSQHERALILPADDGGVYAVPESVLERFRVIDEHRAEAVASLGAQGDEVQGFADFPRGFNAGGWGVNFAPGWGLFNPRWSPDPEGYQGKLN